MNELSFSQPERRSYAVPIGIVVLLVAAAIALIYWFTPHHIAEISVTQVKVLPAHTVFPGHSIKVGSQDQAEDDFYVVARVKIHDTLKLPIFISDLTGTLVRADGAQMNTSAVEKRDVESLYGTFPNLRAIAGALLPREIEIPPGGTAEGDVILDFPITQATWDARSSATITIDTYHQGALTVAIPK